jgi:hypothetical protein
MLLACLLDPGVRSPWRDCGRPGLRRVDPGETRLAGEAFLGAPTTVDGLVGRAYRELEEQTDRQFAVLTHPGGPYRIRVVGTREVSPYCGAEELFASVLATRVLEMPPTPADRAHPLLGGQVGGAYFRFRAVHDLVGHVATGFGFDRDGEYSAWVAQRPSYTGLARWAAATELHGEVSALWTTGQFPEHKAVLSERHRPPALAARLGACTRPSAELTGEAQIADRARRAAPGRRLRSSIEPFDPA